VTPWKYTDASRAVVFRVNDDGSSESCLVEREDVQEWVASGFTILPPDPPPPELTVSLPAFLKRFAPTERIACWTSADPVVIDLVKMLLAADPVHLDDPLVPYGLSILEAKGILPAGRAAVIGTP
jgi:hypothetical protein